MINIRRTGFLVLLGLAACESNGTGPNEVLDPAILSVTIDSSGGPLIRTAHVRLKSAIGLTATWGAPGTPVLSLDITRPDTVHTFVLPRLRASGAYRLQIATATDENNGVTKDVAFATGPLPGDVAPITFTVSGTPTRPVSLIEIVAGSAMLGLLVVEDGQIVGYQRSVGSLFGTARRGNGDIVLLDPSLGLVSYRLDGTLAHRLPQPDSAPAAPYGKIHHDVTTTPNDRILFIANDTRNVGGQNVIGEALWEWTPETNAVVKKWSAFDHLTWPTDRGSRTDASNWLHGNGLAYGSRGNVLFSMRNIDQVLSIAPDFSRVEWRLGGVGATLQLPAGDRFWGQHGISEPAPGRLLVFDNGYDRPTATPFSRAIEYDINTAAGTATVVWQYRRTPDMFAALVGNARRVEGGNTVVLFGMFQGHSGSTGPVVAFEVDAAGTEKWRLTPNNVATRLYRITPLNSLAGEKPGAFRP
jgi:hypothetical protein